MNRGLGPSTTAGRLDYVRDELLAGRPVLLSDIGDVPTPSGSVVIAASLADTHWTAWAVRHSSGFLCVAMPESRAEALDVPLMPGRDETSSTGFCVAVDAADGTTTGISAADRALTARVLADPRSRPVDLNRPGHVVPVRVSESDEPAARDRAALAVDLCRIAGLPPVAVVGDLVADDGDVMGPEDVAALGASQHLAVLSTATVRNHLLFSGNGDAPRVSRGEESTMRTTWGDFDVTSFRDGVTGATHAVLRCAGEALTPTVSVHIECHDSEAFGATDCGCGERLQGSLRHVAAHGGLLIYLRRGAKSSDLGAHECTHADVGAVAAILHDLEVRSVRLRGKFVPEASLERADIAVVCSGFQEPAETDYRIA